jgi:hypothetical protein
MNNFKKFAPTVFIAECDEQFSKGEIIQVSTKYGKEVDCKVYNLIKAGSNGKFYYSIERVEEKNYAEKKAEKYENMAFKKVQESDKWYEKSQEAKDFLALAEPIKIGHHSEKRHRALIDRNWKRMGKSVAARDEAKKIKSKAEYWEKKAFEINLSMPESLEFYEFKLNEAKHTHKGLKNGNIPIEHCYSVAYANKAVKELTKKYEIATLLWGINEANQ